MTVSPSLGWLVWAIASFFYAYQYVIRVLPNILMPEIMAKFSMDASLFGQFSGIYYIGYTVVHLPIGILLDRVGPKFVIPICMILSGIGLLPLVFMDHWIYPTIGRLIIGVGSSGAILGVFKIIRLCFPENRFTVMLGISVTIGLLGAIYGGQPVNVLLNTFGWEIVLQMIFYGGLIMAFISYFLIPHVEKPQKETTVLQDISSVLSNPFVLIVCFLGGLMVGPLEGFADAWSVEFFRIVYNMEENVASSLPSLIFLGMCFGAPLLSYISARSHRYYEITILCALLMMIGFVGILILGIPTYLISIILCMIGFLCGYQILVIYKASSYVSENLIGLTTAFANMVIMAFGYLFHSVIGRLMDASWEGAVVGTRRLYSADAFISGLSVIPIALGIAAIGFMLIIWVEREKKKKLLTAI